MAAVLRGKRWPAVSTVESVLHRSSKSEAFFSRESKNAALVLFSAEYDRAGVSTRLTGWKPVPLEF